MMELNLNIQTHIAEPGDYIKDGFLHCGKCHMPKQAEIFVDGKSYGIRPIMCKCRAEQKAKEDEAERTRKKEQRIAELRKVAFADYSMKDFTFGNAETPPSRVVLQCYNYAKNFKDFFEKGKGLVLYGNVGNGKTYAACCIANYLIDNGRFVLFTNFADIANTLYNNADKDEYMAMFRRCALLIIDDFAMERNTEYMDEIVYNVIDARYKAHKPLIVTTNIDIAVAYKTATMAKQRVYSRILEMCIPLKVEGGDRRKQMSRQNYTEELAILNGGVL